MPRSRIKPSSIEALDQTEAAVARVVDLVRAVLVKYPRRTLDPALLPFVGRHTARAFRRSGRGDEVVLTVTLFAQATTVRFPLELLDAPEQTITRWARDRYWSAIEASKERRKKAAQHKADITRRALEAAQRDHERALQQLAAASAPEKKTPQP
jgi:hypothetical protein